MNDLPFITIINPIRNVERTLETNLKSLLEIDYPKEKMEIVFGDGGSTDRTVDIIRDWQKRYELIKLVIVPNSKSPGEARNAALKMARGDYILFTDGDCAPRKDWARKILEPFFKDRKIDMVGGEIHTLRTDADNDVEAYCEQTKFLMVSGRCLLKNEGYYPNIMKDLPHEVNGNMHSPFFATANAAVSKEAADAVGREFWHEITSEDVDFSLRILKAGFKLYFKPSAIVDHMHRVTLAAYCKQLYGYGFGHPLAVQKHAKNVLEIQLQYTPAYLTLAIPLPKKGIIYIGDFHLMHAFGLAFIITLIQNAVTKAVTMWPAIWGTLFLFYLYRYFKPMLKLQPKTKFFTWAKIRYLSNWALMRGGFKSAKTFGVIYIESSW
ncbi:MAG: glycosyltransferase [Candidatus Omnitrophica bacterium]|nr:glycosyltransferase [Candidatus Omnitrophota bacterium]